RKPYDIRFVAFRAVSCPSWSRGSSASSSDIVPSPSNREVRAVSCRRSEHTEARAGWTHGLLLAEVRRLVQLPEVDLAAADQLQKARRPLDCLLLRAHLQQGVAGDQLLGLGERPVGYG